ncbi:MAG: penicillin-binding protein 2, partial [Steroidobacteraceae bacterium]
MIDLRNTDNKSFAVEQFRARLRWVFVALGLAGLGLIVRAADLQLFDDGMLLKEGTARFARVAKLSAHRGAIYDRNGEALAMSTPVDSVWINPEQLNQAADQIPKLAEALNRETKWL